MEKIIIYLVGIIFSGIICFIAEKLNFKYGGKEETTLTDLLCIGFVTLSSWVGFIVVLIQIVISYGNSVTFFKQK